MKISECLKMALALISNRDCWTRNEMARDCYDLPCRADSPCASKWCGLGAVRKVARDAHMRGHFVLDCNRYLNDAAGVPFRNLNDEQGHDDVLVCFSTAIRRAEENESVIQQTDADAAGTGKDSNTK